MGGFQLRIVLSENEDAGLKFLPKFLKIVV